MVVQSLDRSPGELRRVVEVDCRTDPRWEAFVASHPDGSIYQHPAWLEVLERAYGYRPINLACEDEQGRLRGVLPLCRTRGLVTGRGLASLPRTPLAGPLAADRDAAARLLRAAIERLEGEPGARLLLKVPSGRLDGLADGLAGAAWELTYVLDLPAQPDRLHFGNSRNHARIKWAVGKAARLGVRVRCAETEAELRAWYRLYLETMRWHVVPPRPYRFFRAAWDLLRPRGLMRLLLAEQHEAGRSRLLAGSILLMFGQTVFYAFNGRRSDDLSLRPNDAIQWQAIHDAGREGFRRYDFGAVLAENNGLADFKAKWGAEPAWVDKYLYPAPPVVAQEGTPGGGGARRLANRVWRRLPLGATAHLGDWVFSYL
jgi:CelD/BcsL family acetyltransferase involved in cellulose biosynthesis